MNAYPRDIHNDTPFVQGIEIDKVGIKNLKYPITAFDKKEKKQGTVANISMYVSLPKEFRGTHMSRFVEILDKYKDSIAIKNMKPMLESIRTKFGAKSAHIEMQFPYFIEKTAPRSKAKSLMEYECKVICSLSEKHNFKFILGVEIPVATLCPCSRELVKKGAHNQRAKIKIFIKSKKFVWLEDIVEMAEKCASTSLYSILKREDEQFVTKWAYEHPVFVEDVVRNVAKKLNKLTNITWYSVEVESNESIHNHDAYAFVEKKARNSDSLPIC